MARYTIVNLRADIKDINEANASAPTKLRVLPRNGYIGLDEMGHDGRCIRNIECGSARECLTAAQLWSSNVVTPLAPSL